jgi:hypothetical protein
MSKKTKKKIYYCLDTVGIEPTTFHKLHYIMRSENHTPRPSALAAIYKFAEELGKYSNWGYVQADF